MTQIGVFPSTMGNLISRILCYLLGKLRTTESSRVWWSRDFRNPLERRSGDIRRGQAQGFLRIAFLVQVAGKDNHSDPATV